MNERIHIHPNYWMYRKFVEDVPKGQYEREKTFCNHRNTVEWVKWGNLDVVIKQYKRPTWANCIIYSCLRKTKARRAYEYAEELLKRGFDTARPIAYIERRKWGIFHTGYFISELLPYPLMNDIPQMNLPEEEKELIAADFIRYTACLHEAGIMPKDYNSGNIFFHKRGKHYHFALIDINRMHIGKTPTEKDSALFFEQMGLSISQAIGAIDQYATLRGFDTDRCIFFILMHRLKKHLEKSLKRHVLHPLRGRSSL